MSDEAFARRFYSDRAELLALGVPLQSQRDEFTGEELYTLRSEQYFLPPLELDGRRARRAADRALPARGQVRLRGAAAARAPEPRARPARLRRAADATPRCASRCVDPDYSPEMPGRLGEARGRDLEAAHGQVRRTGRSRATTSPERTLNPYALLPRQRRLVRRRPRPRPRRHPHVPRLAHPRRDPLRDAARARLPHADRLRHRPVPRPAAVADRRHRRRGADRGGGRHRLVGRARLRRRPGASRTASSSPTYSSLPLLASWVLRQDGRAVPLEPDELRREVGARASRACARRTRAPPPRARRARPRRARRRRAVERPAGPVAPERFARPPGAARVPARRAAARSREAVDPGARAVERFHDPARTARGAPLAAQPRQLRRRLLHRLRRAATATRCTSTRSSTATRSARRRG